jgi:hypothetical protein
MLVRASFDNAFPDAHTPAAQSARYIKLSVPTKRPSIDSICGRFRAAGRVFTRGKQRRTTTAYRARSKFDFAS